MTQSTPSGQELKQVFAILSQPVREILAEIEKEASSEIPVVRAILDQNLGYARYAFPRPDDGLEENVLILNTETPDRARHTLNRTPGVLRAGTSLKEFHLA